MSGVIWRSAAITLLAVVASLFIVAVVGPLLGGRPDGRAMAMAAICPLLIAFPAALHTMLQKKQLFDTLSELTSAHESLADAHAELAEAHARLAEKARHDDMTGLLNRESFFAALKHTRRRSDVGGLLIIDADRFKYINDTHGHHNGDAALLMITEAVRQATRADDVVGRIGGEEFAAFLPGAGDDETLLVAERIRLAVEALRFSPGTGKFLPLSVSIGVARLRPHAPWSDLMREADRNLYEAKRRGRNRVVISGPAARAA